MSKELSTSRIKQRLRTIEKNLDKWYNAKNELQTLCPHKNLDKKYRADTGNYDPTADSYWIEFKCFDCGKQWNEDQ